LNKVLKERKATEASDRQK